MARDEDYEIPPARLGRSSHGRAFGAVALVALFLGLAIVKPWAGPPRLGTSAGSPAAAVAEASAIDLASSAAATFGPMAIPPPPTPGWPATAGDAVAGDGSAAQAQEALPSLAIHSGSWGVGNVGVGPRMLRDEPWFDWAAVMPEASSDSPLAIAMWPGTSLCAGYPTIYDLPSLVAVTAPTDLAPDWTLAGWWTDGSRVASIDGSLRQISPAGIHGISYLERVDGERWPAGRYEFHVVTGKQTFALIVCLTRRG
jgi:hypothetical protein